MNSKFISELKGIQQDAILEDDQNSKIGGKATSWLPYKIDHFRFGERRIESYNLRIRTYRIV